MKYQSLVCRSCVALVTVGLLMANGYAQDAELVDAATEYVNLPSVQKVLDSSLEPEAFVNQLAAVMPPEFEFTQEQINEVGQLMAEKMRPYRPEMQQAMITSAVNHFTLAEIQVLSEFYQSTDGASVMSKIQAYMLDVNSAIMPKMNEAF